MDGVLLSIRIGRFSVSQFVLLSIALVIICQNINLACMDTYVKHLLNPNHTCGPFCVEMWIRYRLV